MKGLLDFFKDEVGPFLRNKKNLAGILVLLVLILALPLGLNLLQRQQIIKSRAVGEPIVFVESSDLFQKDGKWITKKPQISLQITSPLGPPPSPSPTPLPRDTSPIISYEAFHFTGSSGQKVIQKFISQNGTQWDRKCTVSGDNVNCPGNGWVKDPNPFLAPDGSNQKIITFGAFTYKGANNSEKIVQSIVDDVGTSWARICTVSGDDVSCPGWDKFASGQTTPDGSKIISYAAVSYTGSSGQKVLQSYIGGNGKIWSRDCTVSEDNVNCPGNGWKDAGTATAPDGSSSKLIAYGAFSINGSSGQEVWQTFVASDGKSFFRKCTVPGNDVDCSRIGGVWGNGWSAGPQVSAP